MGRDAQLFDHGGGPTVGQRVVTLGGGGVGKFTDLLPGQPVVEQIGNGEKGVGNRQRWRPLARHCQQLVERVELHKLDAGLPKDLGSGDDLAGGFDHTIVATVAVVIGQADQDALAVEQTKIDAPGVNANTRGCMA